MKLKAALRVTDLAFLLTSLLIRLAQAQENKRKPKQIAQVLVVGGSDSALDLPGRGHGQ
jgi:hypothetical protein